MIIILTFATEQEHDTFEYLFHNYKNLLLHKAYGILRDPMLAEDAASEAFLRIYRNLHKIDELGSPRCTAFVVTIVKNVALTMLKKEAGRTEELILEDEDPGDGFHLEEEILAQISSERIHTVMEGMSEELRGVFVLKYAYDLPHKEIGRMLGISENNVTVRLHRAKKKLASLLKKEGYADV